MILLLAGLAAWGAETFELGDAHAYHPVWSPDGAHLVVEVNRHADDASLRIVDLDGGGVHPVEVPGADNPFSGGGAVAMNPVWSGTALLFEGTDPSGHFKVYRVGAAGGVGERLPAGPLTGHLTFPSVSSAGAVALVAGDTGAGDVYLVDGGAPRRITDSPVPEMFPILSADGSSVVYSRKVGETEDLFALELATGAERQLVGGAGDQTRPALADGAVVYFDGGRGGGHWDLVALPPSGGRRVLARDVHLPLRARPALSPDGRWVAFTHEGDELEGRVVVVRVDGSARFEVPVDGVGCAEPALGLRDGRMWLAWTALPASGSGWRQLWAADVEDRVRTAGSPTR